MRLQSKHHCYQEQIRKFINLLMNDEIDFHFEYEKVFDETKELHYVTVRGSWANNLARIAEMAAEVDYKDE